nr:immunoglobulin heavy chain junction region [Mus musculus]
CASRGTTVVDWYFDVW